VEYSDVFKASFIALAVLSSIALTVYGLLNFFVMFLRRNLSGTEFVIGASIALLVYGVLFVLFAWLISGEFSLDHGMVWVITSMTLLQIAMLVWEYPDLSAMKVVVTVVLVLLTASMLGRAFASPTIGMGSRKYDVTLKNENLEDVGLVMVTSHHIILYADKRAIVVPTAEVLKLQARATQPRKIDCATAEAC